MANIQHENVQHEKLHDLIEGFDAAMLVTRTADGRLRSRPMALADVEENGTLWFLTQRGSGKMAEIARDEQVNVALQSSYKFVSISGTVTPLVDRAKIHVGHPFSPTDSHAPLAIFG
jgi:general stress protein 26